jgi:hypothetical protein
MSENQSSAPSTVEGELGLDDLEKIAGGTGTLASTTGNPFADDNVIIMKQSDNVLDSYDGVKGSTLDATFSKAGPLVLTIPFP